MHSARVADAAAVARTPGWRAVDALIALRRAGSRLGLGRATPYLLVAPALVLVAILFAGVGSLAWSSLHTYDEFLGTSGSFSLIQYQDAVTDARFASVLERTVLMALVTAVVTVALALPFAVVLARTASRSGRLLLLIAMFVPFLTGDVTRTFGWIVALGPHGPVDAVADAAGLAGPTLLGTPWAIGLGMVQVTVPVVVVILLPAVLGLDPELEAAARTLGARRLRIFASIVLPQLRAAVVAALAIAFALGLAAFADPLILGQGRNDFLGNLLQNRYLNLGNAPLGAAVGVLLLALILAGFVLVMALGRVRIGRGRL